MTRENWSIFKGTNEPHEGIFRLPEPPPWRIFSDVGREQRGSGYEVDEREVEVINAALYLRRPVLVTGSPGTGKTTLAYAVAHELGLGEVLQWPITTRSTLHEGLYLYDAIARLQAASLYNNTPATDGTKPENGVDDIGRYIRLGPLGMAMLAPKKEGKLIPRVLLIDEVDKSDVDFPNEVLHVFEEGHFKIPELVRLPDSQEEVKVFCHNSEEKVTIRKGTITCQSFPLVIMTSNGERAFPPAFMRRCLHLELPDPSPEKLMRIVERRLSTKPEQEAIVQTMIDEFVEQRSQPGKMLATDQLLNAIHLVMHGIDNEKNPNLKDVLFKSLTEN